MRRVAACTALGRCGTAFAQAGAITRLSTATDCHLWDHTSCVGTSQPDLYTDRLRMLVFRFGKDGEPGRWFRERRDLRADFARAISTEADAGLPADSVVAFASDACNTGDSALARFGDIALEKD